MRRYRERHLERETVYGQLAVKRGRHTSLAFAALAPVSIAAVAAAATAAAAIAAAAAAADNRNTKEPTALK